MKKFDINAVSSPNLQSPELRTGEQYTDTPLTTTVKHLINNPKIPQIERLIIELIWRNGLRVSELLKLRGTDIMPNGTFIISASKGSANRIGFIINEANFFYTFAKSPNLIFDCYNRHFIYNMFKRRGIYAIITGNSNKAITHALRHEAIENINKATNDAAKTAEIIGHKRIKSTKHYLKHKIKQD